MVKLIEDYYYEQCYIMGETTHNYVNHEGPATVIQNSPAGGSSVRRSQQELDALEPYESVLSVSCEPLYRRNYQLTYLNNRHRRGQYAMAFM